MFVAREILNQLGGNRFARMTGAKNFVALKDDGGLQFNLPGNPGFVKNNINLVIIHLTPEDLYDIEYCNFRGGKMKIVAKSEGIYCDMLVDDFEETTGLYTKF